jgi:hypothetical protein
MFSNGRRWYIYIQIITDCFPFSLEKAVFVFGFFKLTFTCFPTVDVDKPFVTVWLEDDCWLLMAAREYWPILLKEEKGLEPVTLGSVCVYVLYMLYMYLSTCICAHTHIHSWRMLLKDEKGLEPMMLGSVCVFCFVILHMLYILIYLYACVHTRAHSWWILLKEEKGLEPVMLGSVYMCVFYTCCTYLSVSVFVYAHKKHTFVKYVHAYIHIWAHAQAHITICTYAYI